MYVVLIGRPGVGKGTQSKRLASFLGLQHITTGELLRDATRQGTDLGKRVSTLIDAGDLVPDDLVMDLVRERLLEAGGSGCIFDGIPRTLHQADLLADLLAEAGDQIDLAMELMVHEEEAVKRMLHRAEEENRPDDNLETIKHRMAVYAEQTEPLLSYYRGKGVLQSLDGAATPDEVFDLIKACAVQAQESLEA